MRTIKFRGKDIGSNEWVYGHYTEGGWIDPTDETEVKRHIIHAEDGFLYDINPNGDRKAFFDRMATQHADMLKEVHEKVRDLLEFVGEYLNGQDMVSSVDLAINKTVYDLVYERTKEEDYEK